MVVVCGSEALDVVAVVGNDGGDGRWKRGMDGAVVGSWWVLVVLRR